MTISWASLNYISVIGFVNSNQIIIVFLRTVIDNWIEGRLLLIWKTSTINPGEKCRKKGRAFR